MGEYLIQNVLWFVADRHYFLRTSTNGAAEENYIKGSVKEPNKFHIYETEKITCKASDAAEYIEFGSFTRDCSVRRI